MRGNVFVATNSRKSEEKEWHRMDPKLRGRRHAITAITGGEREKTRLTEFSETTGEIITLTFSYLHAGYRFTAHFPTNFTQNWKIFWSVLRSNACARYVHLWFVISDVKGYWSELGTEDQMVRHLSLDSFLWLSCLNNFVLKLLGNSITACCLIWEFIGIWVVHLLNSGRPKLELCHNFGQFFRETVVLEMADSAEFITLPKECNFVCVRTQLT